MEKDIEIGFVVTFGTYEQDGDFDVKKEPSKKPIFIGCEQ